MEHGTSTGDQFVPDIMVVDDTPANLHVLTEMLKKRGYGVRPVPGGALAIRAARQKKPDLILLDINMPEMNGYEACERLKADESLKDIPVIFISALGETTDKIRAFAVGGVDYVTKPFHFEEVEARVETHLKIHRLHMVLETLNRQLRENYDQLKKLEDLQDNLTHMIVHDMRSPLTCIIGFLDLLEMKAVGKLDGEERAIVADARSSGRALVELVNSILDISRLEEGKMPLDVKEADMDVLIQNALDSVGPLTKSVSLSYRKPSTALRVDCDANLIARVLANLLGNALKFTPEGGEITVSSAKSGAATKLCVADTGNGIPREYHERIFEKFGQVDACQNRIRYSTGLGLAFCKLVIEAHGGEIGVESEVDQGSAFWFTLPDRKAAHVPGEGTHRLSRSQ